MGRGTREEIEKMMNLKAYMTISRLKGTKMKCRKCKSTRIKDRIITKNPATIHFNADETHLAGICKIVSRSFCRHRPLFLQAVGAERRDAAIVMALQGHFAATIDECQRLWRG